MKKILPLLFIVAMPCFLLAQQATIKFHIKNTSKQIVVLNGDVLNPEVMFGEEERFSKLDLKEGSANLTFQIKSPIPVTLYYLNDSVQSPFQYLFFISPGDNIDFTVNANEPHTSIVVKGKGSNNNQPMIQKVLDLNLDDFKSDSLPDNILKAISAGTEQNKKLLVDYIQKYNPSQEFRDIYNLALKHFPLWEYVKIKGSQKFRIREKYYRNASRWQTQEDSLLARVQLSDKRLFAIPNYPHFLTGFVRRTSESFRRSPEMVTRYFPDGDGPKLLADDTENLPRAIIIEKHFTGSAAEYLYADLFKYSINETEDNLPEIFEQFKAKYSSSVYLPSIEPTIKQIVARRTRTLTNDMHVIEDGNAYNTFDDVLKLVKGKTVLLDMWGTWCGPCRAEFATSGDSIKHHFDGKGLEYLYIANNDEGKEKKWKELIAYYQLKGTHLMASKALTNDIMTKVKGYGFPTYVIIHKDGTFELSEAGYPMDRKILYEEIERALKKR